jgi:FixJ family two-component response regulator
MSATVFVVDDDPAVRDALVQLLEADGFRAEAYPSAEAFLAAYRRRRAGCVVLDVRLPGMSGPELQHALAARGLRLPVIFLTGHGDVATSVRALKAGALDFLEKPAQGEELLARVRNALEANARDRREEAGRAAAQARLARLTARELEVMQLVLAGHPNKEIAQRLGISHRTVEIHRTRVMHKMDAATPLELAAVAQRCGTRIAQRDSPVARKAKRH